MPPLPLQALLSHALVAFTIEFDNEAEHRLAHRTTNHGMTTGALHAPWLVSMAMWFNCMQHLDEEGITPGELERRARTTTNLAGMQRWGYITIDPAEGPAKRKKADALIRPTVAGRKAQAIWRPLVDIIEKRWRQRFGSDEIDALRKALSAVANQFDADLPDCMPIVGYGLFSRIDEEQPSRSHLETLPTLPLPALLAKVLLAFAIEYERDSAISIAIGANILILVAEEGVRVRDLPGLSGISNELVATALSFLTKRGYALVKAESASRLTKVVQLTAKGKEALAEYFLRISATTELWQSRFGDDAIRVLRESLERLDAPSASHKSGLFLGLEPHPDSWRAQVPRPDVLPSFPLVTHRGGFPDGS